MFTPASEAYPVPPEVLAGGAMGKVVVHHATTGAHAVDRADAPMLVSNLPKEWSATPWASVDDSVVVYSKTTGPTRLPAAAAQSAVQTNPTEWSATPWL
jgi:hypothetical protein